MTPLETVTRVAEPGWALRPVPRATYSRAQDVPLRKHQVAR